MAWAWAWAWAVSAAAAGNVAKAKERKRTTCNDRRPVANLRVPCSICRCRRRLPLSHLLRPALLARKSGRWSGGGEGRRGRRRRRRRRRVRLKGTLHIGRGSKHSIMLRAAGWRGSAEEQAPLLHPGKKRWCSAASGQPAEVNDEKIIFSCFVSLVCVCQWRTHAPCTAKVLKHTDPGGYPQRARWRGKI